MEFSGLHFKECSCSDLYLNAILNRNGKKFFRFDISIFFLLQVFMSYVFLPQPFDGSLNVDVVTCFLFYFYCYPRQNSLGCSCIAWPIICYYNFLGDMGCALILILFDYEAESYIPNPRSVMNDEYLTFTGKRKPNMVAFEFVIYELGSELIKTVCLSWFYLP